MFLPISELYSVGGNSIESVTHNAQENESIKIFHFLSFYEIKNFGWFSYALCKDAKMILYDTRTH